jgi:hypothetical protein
VEPTTASATHVPHVEAAVYVTQDLVSPIKYTLHWPCASRQA